MATSIIRLPDVIRRTGLSQATIYRMVKSGRFPRSVKLGARAVGWKNEAVTEWISSREQN